MTRITLLIATFLLLACQDNFDEVADTSQRHIELHADLTHMFDRVLHPQDDDFVLGTANPLGAQRLLRLTAYCYDNNDSLVATSTMLAERPQMVTTTLRHLQKDTDYRVVCLADVVERDEQIGYYEAWYNLTPRRYAELHLLRGDLDGDDTAQTLLYGQVRVVPDNQTVDIDMSPATYNGFLTITDTEDVYQIETVVETSRSFRLSDATRIATATTTHRTSFPDGAVVRVPFLATAADIVLPITLRVTSIDGELKQSFLTENNDLRPCIVTVSAATMEITNTTYY